jgi:hypothetical protein
MSWLDNECAPKVKETSVWDTEKRILAYFGWYASRIETSTVVGFPDVVALKRGRTIYIENKVYPAEWQPGQLSTLNKLHNHGATAVVVVKYLGALYVARPKKLVGSEDLLAEYTFAEWVLKDCPQIRTEIKD